MVTSSATFFLSSVLLNTLAVVAEPWGIALPTGRLLDEPGFSPKVTQAPSLYPELAGVGLQQLFQRQLGLHTCGFISAISSLYLTCPNGYVCATGSVNNVAACCDPGRLSICYIPTSCVAATDLGGCDDNCQANPYITKCSDTSFRECYTWGFNYLTATPTQVGCTDTAFNQVVELSYTAGTPSFSGEIVPAATIDSVTEYPTSSYRNPPDPTSIPAMTNSMSSTSETTSSSIVIPVVPPSSLPPQITSPAPDNNDDGGSSTNVGAIVGGVIGGLAFIAIVTGLVVWLLLRNRKNKRTAAAAAAVAATPSTSGPGPQSPHYSYTGYSDAGQGQVMQEHHAYNGGAPGMHDSTYYAPPVVYSDSHLKNPAPSSYGAGSTVSPNSTYATPMPPAGHNEMAPVEADGAPVMTTADGRPVHEAP